MPKGRGPEGEIPLSKARRPRTPCRPSLILTSTRSLRSSRPAVTVATDDTQWFGRFARLLDGAGPGRRPQGLRCAHRQAPALALDPATQAQRVAVMPYCARRVRRRRGVISTLHTGCHFYLAPTTATRLLRRDAPPAPASHVVQSLDLMRQAEFQSSIDSFDTDWEFAGLLGGLFGSLSTQSPAINFIQVAAHRICLAVRRFHLNIKVAI